jgi:hypothetical protein
LIGFALAFQCTHDACVAHGFTLVLYVIPQSRTSFIYFTVSASEKWIELGCLVPSYDMTDKDGLMGDTN